MTDTIEKAPQPLAEPRDAFIERWMQHNSEEHGLCLERTPTGCIVKADPLAGTPEMELVALAGVCDCGRPKCGGWGMVPRTHIN